MPNRIFVSRAASCAVISIVIWLIGKNIAFYSDAVGAILCISLYYSFSVRIVSLECIFVDNCMYLMVWSIY